MLNEIPDDVVTCIFAETTPLTIAFLERTCLRFRRLCRQDRLWMMLMQKYPHIMAATASFPWTAQQKFFRSGMAGLINPRSPPLCWHSFKEQGIKAVFSGPLLSDPIVHAKTRDVKSLTDDG
eukprot:TRINITY_DN12968_c0_g1_i1.p1 TRINITY_DN12968_c0_g1~~TRINITY_DN12968_c0_g1_i1.p1  ORF type:complete len:122 (-),score=6.52 TRINITY_DN12968_c0_g1_i1:31-396(-)